MEFPVRAVPADVPFENCCWWNKLFIAFVRENLVFLWCWFNLILQKCSLYKFITFTLVKVKTFGESYFCVKMINWITTHCADKSVRVAFLLNLQISSWTVRIFLFFYIFITKIQNSISHCNFTVLVTAFVMKF